MIGSSTEKPGAAGKASTHLPPMAVAETTAATLPPPPALPGLARALIAAGKLEQKAAETVYRKAQSTGQTFIAELTGSGAVSPADLAHTLSAAFGVPLLDLDAVDTQRLPKDLLDPKLCQTFRVAALARRNNRLSVATADPSDQ